MYPEDVLLAQHALHQRDAHEPHIGDRDAQLRRTLAIAEVKTRHARRHQREDERQRHAGGAGNHLGRIKRRSQRLQDHRRRGHIEGDVRELLRPTGSKQLSNVALYVATPAVILQSLATTFDAAKDLVAGAACMALSFIFTLVSAGVARLYFRDRQRAAQLGITISNMGFMGIPLVSVLGEEYVFYLGLHGRSGAAYLELRHLAHLAGYVEDLAEKDREPIPRSSRLWWASCCSAARSI